MEQILDIEKGKLAIFTDVHGNWGVYERALEAAGACNATPVFAGDLIHKVTPFYEDRSKEIIDDLAKRVERQECVALLGNHELAHIYEIPEIDKDGYISFENAICGYRKEYIDFFVSMPYAIRTKNVVINHVGTPYVHKSRIGAVIKLNELYAGCKQTWDSNWDQNKKLFLATSNHLVDLYIKDLRDIKELSHKAILNKHARDFITLIKENGSLNCLEKDDSLKDYIFDCTPDGVLLCALFSGQNDIDYPKNAQKEFIDYTLKLFSDKRQMDFLVSGHIHTHLFERLDNQLRFSTGSAIMSNRSFLVIEADREYSSMHELMYGLQKLSGDRKLYERGKNGLEENLNLLKSFLNPKEERGLDSNKAEFTHERDVLYLMGSDCRYELMFNGRKFTVTPDLIIEDPI